MIYMLYIYGIYIYNINLSKSKILSAQFSQYHFLLLELLVLYSKVNKVNWLCCIIKLTGSNRF